ncbi:MAG: toll/interleukin-1 receptor domain-containing protein [Hyphomonadaceae bacterium]
MTDVFISYKKEDVQRVHPIALGLANAGYEVWWDHRIPAGRTYRDVIGAALQTAKCVIVVWSNLSANAQWVLDEADEGKKRNVLLPILIDDVSPPYGFRQIEAARLVGWSGDAKDPEWLNALASVEHFVGRPPGGPPKSLSAPPKLSEAPRASRNEAPPQRSGAGLMPVLGVAAAVALIGGGGYYAWSTGLLNHNAAPNPSDDTIDVAISDPTTDGGAVTTDAPASNSGGATPTNPGPTTPTTHAPAVIVPGDPLQTFFASGYQYCDAKLVAEFWGNDIGETKVNIGWKIINGLADAVPEILDLSRRAGHSCDWIDTGYSYADAEVLARVWGLAEPYQAKLRVQQLVTAGQRLTVERALGR